VAPEKRDDWAPASSPAGRSTIRIVAMLSSPRAITTRLIPRLAGNSAIVAAIAASRATATNM